MLALSFVVLGAFWPVGVNYGAKNIPPIQFLAFLMLGSALLFLAATLYYRQLGALLKTRWLASLTLYSLLITLGYLTIVISTSFTTATDTTLLLQSEIIFAALIGYFLMGEALSSSKILGIVCVFMADFITLYRGGLELNGPHLALFLAPLFYVFANRMSRRMQMEGLHWAPLLFYRHFVGGIAVLILAAFLEGVTVPDPSNWLFLVLFGLVIYGLSKIIWQLCQVRLDLSKATALGLTHPVFSFILARIFLGEVPTIYQIWGIVFSLVGIVFLLRAPSRQWATASPSEL